MIFDRAFAQSIPDGVWDAGFVRATTGRDNTGAHTEVDAGFVDHWNVLKTKPYPRGAYHYANPDGAEDARAQAMIFAHTVLSAGFRKGVDLWMLDLEGAVQRHGAALTQWVRDFMDEATSLLGSRSFLYVGWPWFESSGADISILHEYRWWLPAYGVNDGQDHGTELPPGAPTPVLHQFTSNPFDKSNIVNATAWHELFMEGTLSAQFNPPLSIKSWTQFKDKKGRISVAGVNAQGAVFCIPADAYMGGANGKKYFAGHTASRIVDARTLKRGSNGYVILDSLSEPYGPDFNAAP